MFKRFLLITGFIVSGSIAMAQDPKSDSLAATTDDLAIDTTLDYDALFSEFDSFLDSLLSPRTYMLLNLSGSQGYFTYAGRFGRRVRTVKKYIWSPTLAYYDKSGIGFSFSGLAINDSSKLNMYQVTVTPSFDYVKDRNFALGISYTRYFIKDKLDFYTSPLQNELNAYFVWRKSWLKPGITLNYGWGSRSDYTARRDFLDSLKNIPILLYSQTQEAVSDFSIATTLRHDFYWLDVLSSNDYLRFTPMLSFSMGSQKFGFNQTNGIMAAITTYNAARTTTNVVSRQETKNLDNKTTFKPLSLTLYIRPEYSIGKFFIQPQLLLDYYFPAESKNFTALFSFNAGIMF